MSQEVNQSIYSAKANKIRTDLLICINIEMKTPTVKSCRINSLTSNDIAKKYEKYVIIENNFITGSPIKSCVNDRESIQSCRSEFDNSSINLFEDSSFCFGRRKYTISHKKLKHNRQIEKYNECETECEPSILETLIPLESKEIDYVKNLRKYCATLKKRKVKSKREFKSPKSSRNSHQSILRTHSGLMNEIKRERYKESVKCFSKVSFSLNKNLEIIIKKKKKTSDKVIQLHNMWPERKSEMIDIKEKKTRNSYNVNNNSILDF